MTQLQQDGPAALHRDDTVVDCGERMVVLKTMIKSGVAVICGVPLGSVLGLFIFAICLPINLCV